MSQITGCFRLLLKLLDLYTHLSTSPRLPSRFHHYNKMYPALVTDIYMYVLFLCFRTSTSLQLPAFVPISLLKEQKEVKLHENKQVARVEEFSVSGTEDKFFCNITSSVVLPDGRIVLVDDSNCKLKLADGHFKVTAELKLDGNPLNIAHIKGTEVAVSLPGKREVNFAEVKDDRIILKRKFKTRLDCWGIEYMERTVIITTGRDGHSVILTNSKGEELQSFLLTTQADENIRCPVAVTADKLQKLLYIACTGGAWNKGCVILMDMSGNLLHTFRDLDLDTPRSCSLDRFGKLYICGLESSTVYQMTQEGAIFRIFPSKDIEVTGPLHVNFIRNYHLRFLLTEIASDKGKVFELSMPRLKCD